MNTIRNNKPSTSGAVQEAEYLTKRQVADLLNVSLRSVDNLMAARKLPFFRLNKRIIRFRRSDIVEHLSRCFRIQARGETTHPLNS